MVGNITDLDIDEEYVEYEEFLFLTGIVKQVNLLSVSLTNRDPCG